MTEPTTGHETDDDALGSALRGMPRPAVDPVLRDAQITAALAEVSAAAGSGSSNVVSLAARRRPMRAVLGAVAAAGLFAVGLGVGRAGNSDAPPSTTPARNAALAGDKCTDGSVAEVPAGAVAIAGSSKVALYRVSTNGVDHVVVVDLVGCEVLSRIDLTESNDGG